MNGWVDGGLVGELMNGRVDIGWMVGGWMNGWMVGLVGWMDG